MRTTIYLFIGFILLLLAGCGVTESSEEGSQNTREWLVSRSEVIDGGPGKDGIPSIDDPKFAPASSIEYLDEDRLIIGIKIGDELKAYPHQILDWHEIVNDQVSDHPLALTYCPLTGTALAWDRMIEDTIVEFGVSGLLYRSNLIAYDRHSDTKWAQMQSRGINGSYSGSYLQTYQTIETTWKTWKNIFPNSDVLTAETGYRRNYLGYAYGEEYLNDHEDLLFPLQNEDDRLPNKTKVHAILMDPFSGETTLARAYTINDFSDRIQVINEDYGEHSLVIAGSDSLNFAISFNREITDGTLLSFQPVHDALPVIMQDQEGTQWNLFGEAVSGPRAGSQLEPTQSYNSYWFAIADLIPTICIYPNTACRQSIDR